MQELDLATIRRAQAGDEAALAEIVRSQQGYVYNIALGMLRDPEEAADLTQETFVRLLRALPSYRGEARFTTWLYRLVINLCRDRLRRQQRQVPVVSWIEDDDHESVIHHLADDDPLSDPTQVALLAERQAQVRAALGDLPEPYRLALTLFYLRGFSHQEIADLLDRPLNTVKSLLHRGKALLRETLRAEWEETNVL